MKKNIITLVAISLSLSGCGIYTKYEPATVVPDDLYGGEVVTEDTAGLGNMDWRELFTDPYLQSLIEVGLQTNTDYQSAQLRVEEAQAVLMSAKLAFLPAFALAPQGTVSSFDTQKATQAYSLPVTASWELDVFGRMRNSKKQAKALYAQSEDYRQAVRTQLIAGIANTYYTLLMLDEQLDISRQTEEAWKETVASTRALMNAGLANESAVSQMEAAYYQVQGSVLDLQQQISQARFQPMVHQTFQLTLLQKLKQAMLLSLMLRSQAGIMLRQYSVIFGELTVQAIGRHGSQRKKNVSTILQQVSLHMIFQIQATQSLSQTEEFTV